MNKPFLNYISVLFVCLCFTSVAQASALTTVKSPDSRISLRISIKKNELTYRVLFENKAVIDPSGMGLVINGKKFAKAIELGAIQNCSHNETYAINGVHRMAIDHYNGESIVIKTDQGPFTLEVRVYNNGVAFRYLINNQGNATIDRDSTQFKIPAATAVWSQSNIKYYEGRYAKKDIGDFKAGDLAGPPLTLELPDNTGYASITEGGLIDFAGMSLRADGKNGFVTNLTGPTHKAGNIESPWRIIEIGKDLNALVNCDIVTNVSPAPDLKLFPQGINTEWVKPGRSVWSWLADKREITLDNMMHFSDMAAQLGFEYNLVDEGWGNWKDGTRDKWDMMKELVDYSAKKGVKIWVWKAYPDRAGIPGINTPEKRKEFFAKCKELGIVGLKIDFFDSEAQEIVDFYQDALKDAAKYQIMMDFHGANKPTGENRTWPNELTREAIRGLENQPPWAPGNTTLPFTRYLAGPADFTPVHFGKRLGEVTWAHQVATMVVFTSPLLCLGADPQSMLDNPCKEMIQSVPTTWDETIVLPQSKIGELALYARRKGNTWFLAGLNGLNESKELSIDLSFLKKGRYEFYIVKDKAGNQADVSIEHTKASASEALKISMNKTGGFVIKIDSIKN